MDYQKLGQINELENHLLVPCKGAYDGISRQRFPYSISRLLLRHDGCGLALALNLTLHWTVFGFLLLDLAKHLSLSRIQMG
jgi:hypothetical protein